MPKPKTNGTGQLEIFIEQAEYISATQFQLWTVDHPDEQLILKKLSQAGAKLITGPRGCGKTTLLLKTYYNLCEDASQKTLAIYVNFKTSLKLEPFYKSSANASFLFQQWLIYKIYLGLFDVLVLLDKNSPPALTKDRAQVTSLIQQLELGRANAFENKRHTVLPVHLESDIEETLQHLGYKRCVLLLDDAAHAFSAEQQRDFFDFYRSIKSKTISPKAAIYPGVTLYSPTFHVGHDAEEIDVWLRPDSQTYLDFMRRLLQTRLPDAVWHKLAAHEALLELICFASFGVPRALLNLVRSFYRGGEDFDDSIEVDFSRNLVLKAIKKSYENTKAIYASLADKLPMYYKFIRVGEDVLQRIIRSIKEYNSAKVIDAQSVTIAIRRPVPTELSKVVGFLHYAGLLLPRGEISRGEKGVFELFIVHYAALVDANALLVKKAVNTANYVEAFSRRHSNEFTRITSKALLGTDDPSSILNLSLPPCAKCKTPRIAESAKFCLNCGAPLVLVSTFEMLVSRGIGNLRLTKLRVKRIKDNSKLRTIRDILMDHDHRQLRSVPGIGPYWAERIHSYAEEYIG